MMMNIDNIGPETHTWAQMQEYIVKIAIYWMFYLFLISERRMDSTLGSLIGNSGHDCPTY